ncbi:MAG: PGF-pre-PGF domain-containing protein, partial [Candidatus Aenigmarchaeota archaeon]|nr:PGF-pre-PGF domain-containing protein [Candidatus Aenigmarchaeota archaeon]
LTDINCTLNYTDSEGDTGTIYFEWFKNGISLATGNETAVSNGSLASDALNSTYFVKGDNITCQVYSIDGYEQESALENSTEKAILNTAPVINTTPVNITVNANGSYWEYDYDAIDPDVSDGIDVLSWTDNTTLFDINSSTGVISDNPSEFEAGYYAVLITVSDGEDNNTYMLNYTITDIGAPSVIINSPAVNHYGLSNISISLNISDGFGVDSCWYSLDDWATNTSFNCSVISLNLSEGNYTLLVGANDTSGGINSSESLLFWIDLASPSISFSCNSDRVYLKETLTCTCLATDNISPSENITLSYEPNPSTDTLGDKIASCTATDLAGNTNSSTYAYRVLYKVTGGGGGGGSVSGANKQIVWQSADSRIFLEVNLNKSISGASIIFNESQDPPYTSSPGVVYQYFSVKKVKFENEQIENATLRFRVENLWLRKNNLSGVYLAHYSQGQWVPLETVKANSSLEFTEYLAYLDSFSDFAIVGEKLPLCIESDKRCVPEGIEVCRNSYWFFLEKCENGCDAEAKSCIELFGEVEEVCSEGQEKCLEGWVYSCQQNGWFESMYCPLGCDEAGIGCRQPEVEGVVAERELHPYAYLGILVILILTAALFLRSKLVSKGTAALKPKHLEYRGGVDVETLVKNEENLFDEVEGEIKSVEGVIQDVESQISKRKSNTKKNPRELENKTRYL